MAENQVTIEEVAFDSADAQAMVAEAQAELDRRYGPQTDAEPLEVASFSPPLGAFFVARLNTRLVGGVGLRSIADGIGEIKRLWVDEDIRRGGVARTLMSAAEDAAWDLGMHLVELETGPLQPEAVALYASSGWELVGQLPIAVSHYEGALRFLKRYETSNS